MRPLKLIAVAGTALLLAPATSQAATWRGKTEQGRLAMVVKRDGKVTRVVMRYVARCGDGEVLRSGTEFKPTFDVSTPTGFKDGGSYSFGGLGEGERARARTLVRGKRRAGGVWTGDFRVRIRVTRNGAFVTWCKTGKLGWSANRVRIR